MYYRSCLVFLRRSPPVEENEAACIFTLILPLSLPSTEVIGKEVDMLIPLELSPSPEISRGPKTVARTLVFPISKEAEPSLNLPLITPISAFTDLNSWALRPSNLKPKQ